MSSGTGYLPGLESAQLRRDLSAFFTPPALAQRLWDWAKLGGEVRSLVEPSAGRGALLKPVWAEDTERWVTAVDADPANAHVLLAQGWNCCPTRVVCADFLTLEPETACDLALQNTPFEDGQDIAFVERSLLWAPRVCGIFPAGMFYSAGRRPFWSRVEVTRQVYLSERPRFGGEYAPQTNFCLLELVRRTSAESRPTIEFW